MGDVARRGEVRAVAAAATLPPMPIGITLAVADPAASAHFYTALGAELTLDDAAPYYEGWLGGSPLTISAAGDGAATRGLEIELTVECLLTVLGTLLAQGIPNTLDIGGLIQTRLGSN